MSLRHRLNVRTGGAGAVRMVFGHGFGCNQGMWRRLVPSFDQRFATVLYDLVGSGGSDRLAYDPRAYATLHRHADDLLGLLEELDEGAAGPVVFVGHSVSGTIGMLAAAREPGRFAALVAIGPSPCYVDDGAFRGGFSRADIEALLATLESNHLHWASTMAPALMGAPDQPALGDELRESLWRTDPDVASHFARVIFLSDHRADVPRCTVPTLVLQCRDDIIVPPEVGEYLARTLPDASLAVIDNVGHYPHLSAPEACAGAIEAFLRGRGL